MIPETRLQEARQAIRRIVAEIARLAQSNLPRQEFFRSFLQRVTSAMDAAGGAVWIGRQGRFNLIADIDFQSSQFNSSTLQRDGVRAALRWVEEHKRPLLIQPMGPQDDDSDDAEAPSGIPNVTPMAFFYVPLKLADRVVGILQIWQRPGRDPRHFRTFLDLLLGVVVHAESYLENRQLETAFRDTERLEQLLLVSRRSLEAENPRIFAEQVANLGRDAVGAERLSFFFCDNRARPSIAAISGMPRVDRRHSPARSLTALARPVAESGKAQLWRREQLKTQPPSSALDDFFEQSEAEILIFVPLMSRGSTIGLLAAEFHGHSEPIDQDAAVLEALARQAAPALSLMQARAAGALASLTGRLKNRKLISATVTVVAMFILLSIIRLPSRLEGRCTVWPIERAAVASLEPGKVVEIFVKPGQAVEAGEALLRIENPMLAVQLEQAERELEKFLAEDQRLEAAGDAAGRRVAGIRAAQARREVDFLLARQQMLTLRSPRAGTVVTGNLDQLLGGVFTPRDRIIEIADLRAWEVVVELPEQDVPALEAVLAERGSAEINFVLSSRPDEPLVAHLTDLRQISPIAQPTGRGNVVLVRATVELIDAAQAGLRIGYQGRARIGGPRKSLLSMGLDPLLDRLRMAWF